MATNAIQPNNVIENMSKAGYAFVPAADLGPVLHVDVAQLDPLEESWNSLPRDEYLRDGGRYRSRRHACFIEEFTPTTGGSGGVLTPAPHRAHWQPTSYNALHGGLERWFEPITPQVVKAAVWTQLLTSIGSLFSQLRPVDRWFIEAHQFRIDTSGGIGRPTPEGAHRDGVDFVALMLIRRRNVRGGETRVFDANGPAGIRFTMEEPWSLLLMDDERVIHETTPIQPEGEDGVRDTLVLTYRAKGFQAPS
jgi:hypothetical protein